MIRIEHARRIAYWRFGAMLTRVYNWGGPIGWTLTAQAGYYVVKLRAGREF